MKRLASLTFLAALLLPQTALADAGIPGLNQQPDQINLNDVVNVLVYIIKFGLAFAAAIGAIFVVISGYQYVMSAGNPEKVEKAKMGLTWAITGFVISISSYGIVLLLQQTLGSRHKVSELVGGMTAQTTLSNIANTLLLFAGAVAVLFLIIGGYRYITSQGNQQHTEAARNTILYAVIGLAVVMLSASILYLIQHVLRVSF